MEVLKEQEEFERQRKEKRRQDLIEDENFSTRGQMKLDEMERNRIDEAKEELKRAAEEEVYSAFAKMKEAELAEEKSKQREILKKNEEVRANGASTTANGSNDSSIVPSTVFQVDKDKPVSRTEFSKHNVENIDEDLDLDTDIENDDGNADDSGNESEEEEEEEDYVLVDGDDKDDEIKHIPPPRQAMPKSDGNLAKGNKVDISFTPRIFPTPMRDSKAAEEEDWILKNRRHLKKHAVYKNNIPKTGGTMEEEDPTWMKAKGDDFFRGGDFRSAVNAYSEALEMDEHMIGCYANRAACYLKLKLPLDCQADCSMGISEILGYMGENKLQDIEETSQITLIKLYKLY